MKILTYPNDKLREKCLSVEKFDDELKSIIAEMYTIMLAHDGVGLAAPQVGISKRLFILENGIVGEAGKGKPLIFINPEEIVLSGPEEEGQEGCLSFPGIFTLLKRKNYVKIRAQDVNGEWFSLEGDGLFSRAVQHEYNHINGKLFVDLLGAWQRNVINKNMRKSKRDVNKLTKTISSR